MLPLSCSRSHSLTRSLAHSLTPTLSFVRVWKSPDACPGKSASAITRRVWAELNSVLKSRAYKQLDWMDGWGVDGWWMGGRTQIKNPVPGPRGIGQINSWAALALSILYSRPKRNRLSRVLAPHTTPTPTPTPTNHTTPHPTHIHTHHPPAKQPLRARDSWRLVFTHLCARREE